MQRLQKLIAGAGLCSRRAAEKLIAAGRVTVNGQVITELGSKADPAADTIEVDGVALEVPRRSRYVLLNKPAGYLTSKGDPDGRPTVYDLLFPDDAPLNPVGRLDQATCGLLLLTSDGELANRLLHPRYGVERVYHVWTRPWPKPRDLSRVKKGVVLDDGLAKPLRARIAAPDCFEVVLGEGRNREVRRMFEALGFEVLLLRRIQFGPLTLGRLKEGKARPLRPDEIERLRESVELTI